MDGWVENIFYSTHKFGDVLFSSLDNFYFLIWIFNVNKWNEWILSKNRYKDFHKRVVLSLYWVVVSVTDRWRQRLRLTDKSLTVGCLFLQSTPNWSPACFLQVVGPSLRLFSGLLLRVELLPYFWTVIPNCISMCLQFGSSLQWRSSHCVVRGVYKRKWATNSTPL